nr:cysteine synthase A [uncultured Desulfuromonas sp.]
MKNDLLHLIGNTPLIRLPFFESDQGAELWAKLESANPGASVKDRIALGMIEQAEQDGLLDEGAHLVEPTSGNTGIGLALVCASKGYQLTLTMPESMSIERRRLLKAYGAELILTPGAEGMRGAINKAETLRDENGWFMVQQFNNPANPATHQRTTGPEIYQALDGKLDAFVTAVGTGGTLTGVGRYLKSCNSQIAVIAVEPQESAVLSGEAPGPHGIQGIGAGFIPDVLDRQLIDQVVTVSTPQAKQCARELSKHGILAGISSGANVFAARKIAAELGPGQRVVTTLCDTGERYLSTDVFEA